MNNLSIKIFAIITLLTVGLFSQGNTNPVVSDVNFSISGTTVTVTYDLSDDNPTNGITIRMLVSSNNGANWDYDYGTASGAIGSSVSTGNNKSITWTYSGAPNNNFKIRIIADDNTDGGSTCLGVATVVYEGKTYNTIQIGNQCWLRENLNEGTMIHSLSGGENEDGNQTNNGNIEKYCYNNDDANCTTYGGLYQWAEAVQYLNGATNTTSPNTPFSGHVRGICPEGWHIPTKAEFQTLQSFVGGSFEGNRLKAVSQGSGDGQGTNTSGFSALLAGIRGSDGGLYASGDGATLSFAVLRSTVRKPRTTWPCSTSTWVMVMVISTRSITPRNGVSAFAA
jgi:uncharacterized protein (TIGR02145 family)